MPRPGEQLRRVVGIRDGGAYIPPDTPLETEQHSGGGGGDGGNMEPGASMKDYVDARDDAIESRLNGKLNELPGWKSVWGAALSVVVAILAVMAIASDRFDGGMSVSSVVHALTQKQGEVDREQNAKLDLLDDKLDILLERTAGNESQGSAGAQQARPVREGAREGR